MKFEGTAVFFTTNQPLAFALICAGCTLLPYSEGGPTENTYTVAKLRSHRHMWAPDRLSYDDAVVVLEERKIPGDVSYFFVRNSTLQTAIAVWDALHEEMLRARTGGVDPILPDVSTEDVMRVHYFLAVSRDNLRDVAFARVPRISTLDGETKEVPIPGKEDSSKFAPKRVTKGKGQIWTLGTKH